MYLQKKIRIVYYGQRGGKKGISAAVLDGELIGIYAQGDHAENCRKKFQKRCFRMKFAYVIR